MWFYLFIVAFLSLFGSFTLLFVIANLVSTTIFLIGTIIVLSILFVFPLYKIWKYLSTTKKILIEKQQQLKTTTTQLSSHQTKQTERFDALVHQIEKPITQMQGILTNLVHGNKGKLTKKIEESIKTLLQNNATLIEVLKKHVLTIQLESKTAHCAYTIFNIKEIVSDIADSYRKQATQKGILLSFKSDTEGRTLIRADKAKISLLISELIENALKFTTRGSITLFVYTHRNKKQVAIDVIDSGIGLEQDMFNEIFKKYHRNTSAIDMQTQGVGLGLYTSSLITKQFGGSISAHSKGVGHGTTIHVTLPIQLQ